MIDRTIEVERMEHVISVFGSFDQNLRLIETELNVKILDRDNLIHITGEAENVMLAEKTINGLLELAARGENIDAQNVRYILKLVQSGREGEIQKLAGDVICITAKGKPIKPKTIGQREYCEAIANNTVTLGIGPAGTGKTYLAVAAAVAFAPLCVVKPAMIALVALVHLEFSQMVARRHETMTWIGVPCSVAMLLAMFYPEWAMKPASVVALLLFFASWVVALFGKWKNPLVALGMY